MKTKAASSLLLLLLALMIFPSIQLEAQIIRTDSIQSITTATNEDSINEKDLKPRKLKLDQAPHSAKKATIMSACLPGLGQIYNKKWWKVPIIYGGIGGIGYLIYFNNHEYNRFLMAYRVSTGSLGEGEVATEDAIMLSESYPASSLLTYKDSYRRDFELYCIIMAAWYGLNIIDATVDGHLYYYDISDDLSFSIDPDFSLTEIPFSGKPSSFGRAGLSFKFKF